jgi:phospholipase/carboxylesterase
VRLTDAAPDMTPGLRFGGEGPHKGQPVRHAGAPLDRAKAALVLVHGRGATAESILTLAAALPTDGVACLAPQAATGTWYPNRFLAPIASNEPWLSSALAGFDDLVAQLDVAGLPPARTVLLGFSQGGCLALEYAVRHPRRYGGLVGLSAGLIGPPGTVWPSARALAGTPVFLGCSDVDPHVPADRVEESARVLTRAGAHVVAELYPGMDHTVTDEELEHVRRMLRELAA